MINRTIKLIKVKHKGQIRKVSKEPYHTHPINVMNIVKEYTTNKEVLITALLHDVIEDTDMTTEQMLGLYGSEITNMVCLLTNDDEEVKRIGKCEHIKNKFDTMCDMTLLIKLCDIQSNIMDNPRDSFIERIKDLIEHLESTRKLSLDHLSVIEKIKSVYLNKKDLTNGN